MHQSYQVYTEQQNMCALGGEGPHLPTVTLLLRFYFSGPAHTQTVKACSQLGKTISDAHANKAKFLLTTGSSTAVVNGRQEHSSSMSRKLQQLSTLVKQVLAVKTSDHVAFGLCQSTQLDLQNALQVSFVSCKYLFACLHKICIRHILGFAPCSASITCSLVAIGCSPCQFSNNYRWFLFVQMKTMEDPPEELFDAAEKACEAYDGSTSHTQAIRQKFLTICSEIDTLSQSQVS
jgi:hypothetical protein